MTFTASSTKKGNIKWSKLGEFGSRPLLGQETEMALHLS